MKAVSNFKFGAVLVLAAAMCSCFFMCAVYAQDRKNVQPISIGYEDMLEQFKQKHGSDISLDAFIEKDFDGCYGNQLDSRSKIVYDALVDSIERTKSGKGGTFGNAEKDGTFGFVIEGLTWKDFIVKDEETGESHLGDWEFLLYGIAAFDYDYPEIFWIDMNKVKYSFGSFSGYEDGELFIVSVLEDGYDNFYTNGYKNRGEVESDCSEIEKIKRGVLEHTKELDVYSKVKYFNDMLVDKNEYNRYVVNGETDNADKKAWQCVSALIYGSTDWENKANPVCEGYARAFKLLCDDNDIPCVLASGFDDKNGAHMWNYVQMYDGKWYAVDVTWNDPVFEEIPSQEAVDANRYNWFLLGKEKFFEKHIEDGSILYDTVSGLSYPDLSEADYVYDKDKEPKPIPFVLGDANLSGTLEPADASCLLERILDGKLTEKQEERCDIDGNGIITAYDAACILKAVLNGDDLETYNLNR